MLHIFHAELSPAGSVVQQKGYYQTTWLFKHEKWSSLNTRNKHTAVIKHKLQSTLWQNNMHINMKNKCRLKGFFCFFEVVLVFF